MLIIAEYIWLDTKLSIRTKSRTINIDDNGGDFNLEKKGNFIFVPDIKYFDMWNYDGSSTGQATGYNSEIRLVPVAVFIDPIRNNLSNCYCYLVLCECYSPQNLPIESNSRAKAREIFDLEEIIRQECWFGIEQEYVLYDINNSKPLGWDKINKPQGPYYCGVGSCNVFGRHIVEKHYQACISAGVKISGINAEVMPGQWEFQIGPCIGITAADHLIIARYLLERICEEYNVYVSYEPKPEEGDWNGSGLHTNYSSISMRDENGLIHIIKAMDNMKKYHLRHIDNYGDNTKRLSGTHETSKIDTFTYGIGDRNSSVRIPTIVYEQRKGYFEDRRPASNADPYIVTKLIAETVHLL